MNVMLLDSLGRTKECPNDLDPFIPRGIEKCFPKGRYFWDWIAAKQLHALWTMVLKWTDITNPYLRERKRRMIVFAVLRSVHGLFLLWNLVSHDYFIVSTMLVFAAL
jgi:hypothetical protein